MKCIIPGANVKVFGRAIHSLSKIGEELYFEALEHGLALRTVNSSRSAYACFVFSPSFFLYYSDEVSDADSTSSADDEIIKYKINMKSCLTVFKSLSTLEKTVDKCKIKLNLKESRLVFQLYCKHGIVKTHNLTFIECETLQAVFSKDLSPNVLTAQTKLLCEIVLNFQSAQDEVTLSVDPVKVRLNNYIGEEKDAQKAMHTEVILEPDEFESFQVGVDTNITFCLKELRAILAFSEPSNLPISMHFETPGKPIVLSMETDPSFEANFVLATLGDNDAATIASQASQPASASQNINDKTKRLSETRPRTPIVRKTPAVRANEAEVRPSTSMNGSSSLTGPAANGEGRQAPFPTPMEQRTPAHIPNNGGGDSTLGAPEVARKPANQTAAEEEEDMECSPVIPVQHSYKTNETKLGTSLLPQHSDSEPEEEEESIPGTPPRKKVRVLFQSWSQSTTSGSQRPKYTVLAPDSDDEG